METKNLMAKCLDRNDPSEYVEHLVMYDQLVDDKWLPKTITLMATDPMQAIKLFQMGSV
jgi:hypothetical protein